MEENKNNAIEKTENLTRTSTNKPKNSKSKKASKVKKQENKKSLDKKAKLREQKAEIRHKKLKEKQQLKEEKKKVALSKKEEAKKAKLQKKANIKKAKMEREKAKREKNAKLKELRLQKREERLKRREFLKQESKEERQKRLAKEKQLKLALKREKLADKKAKRLERQEERKQIRQSRRQERKDKRNRGVGGWLAAVISLGCAVLVLGSLLTLSLFTPLDDYQMTNTAEERSFYDLVGYIDNMDVNLSKLVVSKDSEKQQKLLSEVRVESSLAASSISMLALQDESKFYTTKFINQVGDFAKYLQNKLIDGEKMSEEDVETLSTMHKINYELKLKLGEIASSIGEDFDFTSIYEGKEDNLIISRFNELESNAVEYPHMIYDGAFSDNVKGKETKFLNGLEEVSKMQAEEAFRKYFKEYNVKDIELVGEAKSDTIECYDFDGKTSDGDTLTAQISKKGGKLILFNFYKECSKDVYDANALEIVAENFLEQVGYKNMKAVWMDEGNNTVSYNFASIVDGIICYSDLVKVNVCKERGIVSGIEASAYILNHTKRQIPKAKTTLNKAQAKVESEIEIESSRLAIIPINGNKETLAYEFFGTNNGDSYYIYIDAVTGREVDIFKVVRTTEGTLLM